MFGVFLVFAANSLDFIVRNKKGVFVARCVNAPSTEIFHVTSWKKGAFWWMCQ